VLGNQRPRRKSQPAVFVPSTSSSLVDRLDEAAEEFSRELGREYYLNGAGLKEDLVIAPVYERHGWMFARGTVDELRHLPPGDERYHALREFVVDGFLENSVKELTEAIAERETKDTIRWNGEDVPYRSIAPLLANESNPERRRQLDALRADLTAQQNDLREKRWMMLHREARDLGYENYVDLCDDISRLHLPGLAEMVEDFLWSTDDAYRERLEKALRDIGIPPARAEKCDLAFLFRAPQFDSLFPKEKLQHALDETLRRLGIELASQSNVELDIDPRPLKSPRAFCSAIQIPDEIKLVINPQGGQDDYRALMHEAGHTEHFAHVSADQPYAYRGLGDNSVTEGFAFLIEHLAKNRAWLEDILGIADPEPYLAFTRFQELYMLRRYCAKLCYELELHVADNPKGKARRYADTLTAAVGVRYWPADYLHDVDDGFYAAKYLRAWTFEAQVRHSLEERHGERWWDSPEGGAQLKEWWNLGQRYPVEGLLQRAGHERLDMNRLRDGLLSGS
jgi:hypothetical protein